MDLDDDNKNLEVYSGYINILWTSTVMKFHAVVGALIIWCQLISDLDNILMTYWREKPTKLSPRSTSYWYEEMYGEITFF